MVGELGIGEPANNMQRSVPSRSREKVFAEIDEMAKQRSNRRTGEIFRRSSVGPIDEQWFSEDVVSRNKAPIATVQRIIPVIAHGEIAVWRHHHLAIHHVMLQHVALQLAA